MKEMEVVELDDDEDTNDSCYTPTKPSKKTGGQKPTAAKKTGLCSLRHPTYVMIRSANGQAKTQIKKIPFAIY